MYLVKPLLLWESSDVLSFSDLQFRHELNTRRSWSLVVVKGTHMLAPHRGTLQTGSLGVETMIMNFKKTLQMVLTCPDG